MSCLKDELLWLPAARAASARRSPSALPRAAQPLPRDIAAAGRTPRNFSSEMVDKGTTVSIHQGRVDDASDCNRVVQEVMDRFGRVDYLINNAGITVDKTVRKMTVDDWRQVLDVNLSGAFQMTKAVLEHMIERGSGRIVNISSVIGETGNIGQANYAASKAGLFGFSKSLALEMAQRGITVNCVAPGLHRDRNGVGDPRGGAGEGRREDPATPARPSRRSRPGRPVSARGRIELYHRGGLFHQRRPGYVGTTPLDM